MTHSFIPTGPASDSVSADPGEIRQVADWAEATFGEQPAAGGSHGSGNLLLPPTVAPLSFTYDGRPSAELLAGWRRTVERQDDDDRVRYRTSYTDPATGLRVTAIASAFKEYAAVEWLLDIENTGTTDTPILEGICAADLVLPTEAAGGLVVLHQLRGDSCDDMSFQPFETALVAGRSLALVPARGRPSQETAFPFWNLQFGERGIVTAIGWSGQWAAWFDRAPDGPTRFRSGMERTHLRLHPGERIRTPRVLQMPWHGDRRAAQNRFRRLMLSRYVPQKDGRPLRLPTCLQTFDRYSRTDWWPTEAGQLEAVRAAHDLGCDTYWLDAAWFVGGFPAGAGNWDHKPAEFPNGLKPIGDLCRSLDMDFIVWFEPCRVAEGTRIAREHPEFVLGGDRSGLFSLRDGLFNLGDPEALRWLTDLLSQRISEYGITVYREDFNIDPLDYWRSNDAPDRQGITEIRFVEGHYALWDALRARHPGLWIDNCASGGRRIDLETCMRSVPLWRSDTSCGPGHPEWNQLQSVGLSQFVPLNTACAWDPDSYTTRSSATGGQLCQFDYKNPAFQVDRARALLAESKANRAYWYGDLYPLTPVTAAKDLFFAYQLHRADLNEGIVMAFRRPECAALGLIVALQAVDPETQYEVEFVNGAGASDSQKMTGKELASTGLTLRIDDRPGSLLVRYRPAAKTTRN